MGEGSGKGLVVCPYGASALFVLVPSHLTIQKL